MKTLPFIISFLIGVTSLFGKETPSLSPPKIIYSDGGKSSKLPGGSPKAQPSKEMDLKTAAAAMIPRIGQSEIMMINPEMRSQDIQESFQYLKKVSPSSKVAVKLVSGVLISDILNMQLMKGGTMIIFRINSIKGQKFQVVKIEDIDTIINE